MMPALGTTETCAGAAIVRQASVAGGLGACYAPSGEREGQRPLARMSSKCQATGARRVPSGC